MSEVDGATLALGVILTITGWVAAFRPHTLVRDSRDNWQARLRELNTGAPEAFFEERRQLESYPPRFNLTNRTIRWLGAVQLVLGIFLIFRGLN